MILRFELKLLEIHLVIFCQSYWVIQLLTTAVIRVMTTLTTQEYLLRVVTVTGLPRILNQANSRTSFFEETQIRTLHCTHPAWFYITYDPEKLREQYERQNLWNGPDNVHTYKLIYKFIC